MKVTRKQKKKWKQNIDNNNKAGRKMVGQLKIFDHDENINANSEERRFPLQILSIYEVLVASIFWYVIGGVVRIEVEIFALTELSG